MTNPLENLTPKARRTRAQLIAAARSIIGRKGVGELSVAEVCDTARVGRTSFYNYFEDVWDLVGAVVLEAAQAIKSQFDDMHEDEPRGLARLEACLEMLLAVGVEEPETALLLTSLSQHDRTIRSILSNEIASELDAAGIGDVTARRAITDYLTTTLLALVRDIALDRISDANAKSFVSMMMASCAHL